MSKVARASACSIGFSRWPESLLKPALQTKVRATRTLHTTFLLLFAMLTSAAPLDLSAWKYRKRIPLTPGDGLAAVKLDREVYLGSQFDLDDLRVIRDGVEVPYVRETLGNRDDHVVTPEKLLDLSVVDGPGVQFTMRVPRLPHNRTRLQTGERNFRKRVRIEASADNVHWATLRSDGAIFDFTQDGRQFSSLAVDFPVSTKPYLRVTILGWDKIAYVQGADVDYEVRRSAVRETLATVTPQVREDAKQQSTVATFDLGVQGLPVDRIVLEVSSPQFQRAVGVEVSTDAKDWSYLSQGVIARLPGTGFTEEWLGLSIPRTSWRYFRLRIYNRDDQAVQIVRVQFEGLIRRIKFVAPAAGDYWLYYSNINVRAPAYDLPILLSRLENTAGIPWTLGPAELNPAYHPPAPPRKPWSEQHPAILYTVLGGAVLALGIATFRFASRLRPTS